MVMSSWLSSLEPRESGTVGDAATAASTSTSMSVNDASFRSPERSPELSSPPASFGRLTMKRPDAAEGAVLPAASGSGENSEEPWRKLEPVPLQQVTFLPHGHETVAPATVVCCAVAVCVCEREKQREFPGLVCCGNRFCQRPEILTGIFRGFCLSWLLFVDYQKGGMRETNGVEEKGFKNPIVLVIVRQSVFSIFPPSWCFVLSLYRCFLA